MPAFTSTQPGLRKDGPIARVMISPVAAAEAALRAQGVAIPAPIQAVMLVDTGAALSAVVPDLVQKLGLQPVGVAQVVTPSTTTPVTMPTYAARLTLETGQVFETTVLGSPLHGQNIQGLIGRDVLSQCVLIYIGYANQFTIAM